MRAALVEILRLLNQAERFDDDREKGLELQEIQELAADHWSVQKGGIKPAQALGLLIRNKMVDHVGGMVTSWTRGRDFGPHYRINGSGKVFLKEYIDERERVHSSGPKRI